MRLLAFVVLEKSEISSADLMRGREATHKPLSFLPGESGSMSSGMSQNMAQSTAEEVREVSVLGARRAMRARLTCPPWPL
jgi:hypothetical protein